MEAAGIPGRIHVSATTQERLNHRFDFEPRALDVKGLGEMKTYLLREI